MQRNRFKTVTFFMQMLRPGEKTLPLKQSASLVCSPFEGSGYSQVGDKKIEWNKFDTVVVGVVGTWRWGNLFCIAHRPDSKWPYQYYGK